MCLRFSATNSPLDFWVDNWKSIFTHSLYFRIRYKCKSTNLASTHIMTLQAMMRLSESLTLARLVVQIVLLDLVHPSKNKWSTSSPIITRVSWLLWSSLQSSGWRSFEVYLHHVSKEKIRLINNSLIGFTFRFSEIMSYIPYIQLERQYILGGRKKKDLSCQKTFSHNFLDWKLMLSLCWYKLGKNWECCLYTCHSILLITLQSMENVSQIQAKPKTMFVVSW